MAHQTPELRQGGRSTRQDPGPGKAGRAQGEGTELRGETWRKAMGKPMGKAMMGNAIMGKAMGKAMGKPMV